MFAGTLNIERSAIAKEEGSVYKKNKEYTENIVYHVDTTTLNQEFVRYLLISDLRFNSTIIEWKCPSMGEGRCARTGVDTHTMYCT